MNPIFEPTQDGIRVIDPIERKRYLLATDESVDPKRVEETSIPYPVGSAIEITARNLTLPTKNPVYVYDTAGQMIMESDPTDKMELPEGEYALDISNSIKLYAGVESSVKIYSEKNRTCIDLNGSSRVVLGARSYHTQPAGSITTTTDPSDVMQAVSAFGSALKTIKPERSYPTLRGHPPTLEIGQELDIPPRLEPPETGIRIEVPRDLGSVYVVAPLAYYLGAKVEPGSSPRLFAESNYSVQLTGEPGFESLVEQLLQKTIFLDCLVRVAGPSSTTLEERDELDSVLEFDLEKAYDQSPSKRLQTYVSVPFEKIEPYIPDWRRSILDPVEESVFYLPFLANDLTAVRTRNRQRECDCNLNENRAYQGTKDRTHTSSCSKALQNTTIEQCWDDGTLPKIMAKTPLSAFYNDINRTLRSTPIEIQVVCNDPGMNEELAALYSTYGNREGLSFDIELHHDLTVRELAEVLEQTSDFVHYIGHTEENGFRCADGYLDAWSLDSVGAKAFLLNSCRSYEQGLALLEAGSVGGIATLNDINNADAIRIGSTIAQLLNQGFPLYAAANMVRAKNRVGGSYQILGKGTTTVSQSKIGLPVRLSLTQSERQYHLRLKAYAKERLQIGSTYQPYLSSTDAYHLLPKEVGPITVSKSDFAKITDMGEAAILLDDKIKMANDVKFKDIGLFGGSNS
ncbi:hypothetical protein [Natronococcus sp.]|uniref:hypothetical protein n=1 Tax=Natronococcus sp. TaxID=35747 RepID=UPI0025DB3DAC|nr:hypothetical protein [Natronococcus sp.]